jgi:hypothetical protein
LIGTRSKEALQGIGEITIVVYNVNGSKQGAEPSDFRSSESLEPIFGGRNCGSNLVDLLVGTGTHLNTSELGSYTCRSATNVVDARNLALVTTVVAVEELLDQVSLDTSQHLFDRAVGDVRVFDSYGSLENADTLRVLIEDGVNVFSSPEGILNEYHIS